MALFVLLLFRIHPKKMSMRGLPFFLAVSIYCYEVTLVSTQNTSLYTTLHGSQCPMVHNTPWYTTPHGILGTQHLMHNTLCWRARQDAQHPMVHSAMWYTRYYQHKLPW